MCLMGGKAASHPCSHQGENVKCSKNNHQHLMYIQSLYRWERRYLNCVRLPIAWWMKLSIICKQWMERGRTLKVPCLSFGYLLLWASLLKFFLLLFWGDTPWFPLPAHEEGSKQAQRGRSQLLGRQLSHDVALEQPLLHPRLHMDLLPPGDAAAGLVSSVGKWGDAQLQLPWAPRSSTLPCLEQTAPVDFERTGCLWWLFWLLRASSLSSK